MDLPAGSGGLPTAAALRSIGRAVTRHRSGPLSSAHADFWNTWDQEKLETEVDLCLRRQQVCGGSSR